MRLLPRIKSAEPVIHGVLKLVFLDGYEGVVDLRPLIAEGKIFTRLQDAKNFATVKVDEYGHSVSWVDSNGYEIDLGADSLMKDCLQQAEAHRLMMA